MFPSLCILGRQPALGLAELESLYGSEAIQPIGDQAAFLNCPPAEVPFAFLGGTVKFCKLLTVLDSTNWSDIHKFLLEAVPQHAKMLPEGKLKLGLSVYGLNVAAKQLTATGLEIKKTLKSDRSVRVVPNQEPILNAAQVLHNGLTKQLGWELVFVKDNQRTIVAQTIAVQDIESYSLRDRGRPKRDAKVGMLPPKLAQVIINLAKADPKPPFCEPTKKTSKTDTFDICDPFCGTGVILQEALLMGYSVIGGDKDPRMVEYSKENLLWLTKQYNPDYPTYEVKINDATEAGLLGGSQSIASEVYLGRPFTSPPTEEILRQTIQDVNTITKKFLQNLASQTKPDFRFCLALPAWHHKGQIDHLPLLDQMSDLGYNRLKFVHAADTDLIYHRPNQVVGRELVTLIRK